MKIRNNIIISLAIIGVLLFGFIQFKVIPEKEAKQAQYVLNQQDPITHDLNSILKYKSRYMGDSSNIINLFGTLPYNNHKVLYQLYPDTLKVELNYDSAFESDDYNTFSKIILYNSTAAFALIDNLKVINYNFGDGSFWVFREDVAKWYGKDLKALLVESEWQNNVQGKLKNRTYVDRFTDAVLRVANSRI